MSEASGSAAGRGRWLNEWRGLVVPVGFLLVAEIAAIAMHLKSDTLASPSDIALAWIEAARDGTLLKATLQTVGCALGGLVIGGLIGLTLGVLLGLSRIFDRLLVVSVEAVRPIPAAAMIPVALLICGFGFRMEVSIVAFSSTWPVLIFARAAVASVEPRLLEVARALGLSLGARVWKIVLPAALPRIFVAFRLAAGIALIVAVTVEVAANPIGLGNGMMLAQQSLKPALMFAFLIWIGILGWAINAAFLWAQRRLFGPAAIVNVHQ